MIPEPVSLGPQPTPEMDAIAREVDALARERLALEAELAVKQREVTVKSGESDSLQSELDTLTATLKQLENQKGEAQKRLNDLKSQVDKLRSQVSAQEAAAAETEAEAAARRAAAAGRLQRERALRDDLDQRAAAADALTAQLSSTVLSLSQANIKMSHLEEHYAAVSAALAALDAGGAGASLTLQPLHTREHLERLVRGCTPSDALEEDAFAKSEVTVNGSFAKFQEPFAAADDPFAPSDAHNAKDAFGAFSATDPFAGDAFTPKDTAANDSAWESDPFAVLHAPTRPLANTANTANAANAANPSANAAAKRHKTPPPRPAPPRPLPPHKR